MKFLPLVLLGLIGVAGVRADELGGAVAITPSRGWIQADARDPGQERTDFPTLKYVPADGRNAAVFLSLIPVGKSGVTDRVSLRALFLRLAAPMFPAPGFVPDIRELAVSGGFGLYASFEDPSLMGKPPEKGNYKVATPVDILLENGFILHSTVFTDAPGTFTDPGPGDDFSEGLGIVASARVLRAGGAASASRFAVPGLDMALRIPATFTPMPDGLESNPTYFSFQNGQGVILSGWLDRASRFQGIKPFWAKEKAALEGKAGIQLKEETLERIGDWDGVRYVVMIGDAASQKNIRACRVAGGTWADVHVSITAPGSTWKDLEDAVLALGVETAQPPAPARQVP